MNNYILVEAPKISKAAIIFLAVAVTKAFVIRRLSKKLEQLKKNP